MIFGEGSERKKLEQQRRSEGRLPPGQSLTLKWPVLHEGNVPRVDLRTWDFRIEGLVEKPVRFTWEEFNRLPQTEIQCDMHCVTRWSRFDNRFEGVLFTEVMQLVTPKPASPAGGPEARFARVRGFELTAQDEPGFWEQNGYHIRGDPWKEQRFDTD